MNEIMTAFTFTSEYIWAEHEEQKCVNLIGFLHN